MADLAAIVLAGGRSSRMGTDKALLDWHGSTLLRRVTGILQRVAEPVIVVAAAGRRLPDLPGIEQATDRAAGRGPLEGIAAGLRALGERRAAAFVTAVDAPFLHPEFVASAAAALPGYDVVLPLTAGHHHPTAAVYRTGLLTVLDELLEAGQRAPADLFARVRVRSAGDELLTRLESLDNVNTPAEYAAALQRPQPLVQVADGELRAGTLGVALRGAGLVPPSGIIALNGRTVAAADDLPLVDGDVVSVAPAG
jgi:molybdopterin-guanine dinucleotide biosynthesis protein A